MWELYEQLFFIFSILVKNFKKIGYLNNVACDNYTISSNLHFTVVPVLPPWSFFLKFFFFFFDELCPSLYQRKKKRLPSKYTRISAKRLITDFHLHFIPLSGALYESSVKYWLECWMISHIFRYLNSERYLILDCSQMYVLGDMRIV